MNPRGVLCLTDNDVLVMMKMIFVLCYSAPRFAAAQLKKAILIALLISLGFTKKPVAQSLPLSQQMTETAMKLWPDSFSVKPGSKASWSYDQGVILKGIEGVWQNTGDTRYFNYIQHSMDYYVRDNGSIYDYNGDDYNIDHINNGKVLLTLYRVSGREKYRKAVEMLRNQLRTHPRTEEGGFWHKKIYPSQVWLDGLYMSQPFYAEYAQVFHEDSIFNDVAKQFAYMELHARDPKTGLLYHGWDESRQQQWANKETGTSSNFWGRAMGWYGMAMVDALDYIPGSHREGRLMIVDILKRYAEAIVKVQDKNSGLWYNILDKPLQPKNYKEASASCMIVYTLAKAVRLGYIPRKYLANAEKGYAGIVKEFLKTENGQLNLYGTVAVSGLGGNPYRDGSFGYYMKEPVVVNDPKGMGAFIQCAVEMEMVPTLSIGRGKQVMLDRYFNSEKRKDVTGTSVYWHYVWDERSNPGFSTFGQIFKKYGAWLSYFDKPNAIYLGKTDVYIIVDPDHVKDNPVPNYVTDEDVKIIKDWVKQGGALLLMANDSNNCDLSHFNKLANAFGINFTDKSVNMVKDDHFPTGSVLPGDNNPVFKTTKEMFLKEVSTITVQKPAQANAVKDSDIIIATAKYGKGVVIAVGDPWLYNEYIDGRKLPAQYENYKAGEDLAKWLLEKSNTKYHRTFRSKKLKK